MDRVLLEDFANHLSFERQLARNTVAAYTSDTEHFLEYCDANEISPQQVQPAFLDQYNYQLKNVEGLSSTSVFRKMEAVKSLEINSIVKVIRRMNN